MTHHATAAPDMPALVRLLQLASPGLPIGGYSYSQGLEWAVEQGLVRDADSAERWIADLLEHVIAHGEAPLAWRLATSVGSAWTEFERWNAWQRVSRETAELRSENEQMGHSLVKLALDLGLLDEAAKRVLPRLGTIGLPAAFALTAHGMGLSAELALAAYVWSWLENQILAAVKLVPLGQVAGQRMLASLGATLPDVLATAKTIADDDISNFAPGFAIACAGHETQYSRLFRS